MLPFIMKAAENFCIHQIRLPHKIVSQLPKKRTLIAYLDIQIHSKEQLRTYIGCDKKLLECISKIFLGEGFNDNDTLRDMLLETTNMIVGSAKVICEESEVEPFTISTPHFVGNDYATFEMDQFSSVKVAGGTMFIGLKGL